MECDMDQLLKGQCHEIFCFWFFSWTSFPQASDYTIRAVQIFFENSRRYSQLKVSKKNSKRSKWNTLGLGGNWIMKKTISKKSRDTVPLSLNLGNGRTCKGWLERRVTIIKVFLLNIVPSAAPQIPLYRRMLGMGLNPVILRPRQWKPNALSNHSARSHPQGARVTMDNCNLEESYPYYWPHLDNVRITSWSRVQTPGHEIRMLYEYIMG